MQTPDRISAFVHEQDPSKRQVIRYLLGARIASGLENHEPGANIPGVSISSAWEEAASHIDTLIESGPDGCKTAFDLAMNLTLLPRDTQNEPVYQWIRGDGPVLLAKPELRSDLVEYVRDPGKAFALRTRLHRYMAYDIAAVPKDKIFRDSSCFLTVATLYLGTRFDRFGDVSVLANISERAHTLLSNPGVSRAVRYYLDYPETAWIAEALNPYLHHTEPHT